MQMIKYPKIPRLNSNKYNEFMKTTKFTPFLWDIYLSEKIDGANASVRLDTNGTLHFHSRNKKLDKENNLRGFYEYASENASIFKEILKPNQIIFGEWLVPHRIKYKSESYNKFYAFNIYDIETGIFSLLDKKEYPCIEIIKNIQLQDIPTEKLLQSMLDSSKEYKNKQLEGFVIKLINKETQELVMFKYINKNILDYTARKTKTPSEETLKIQKELQEIISPQSVVKTIYKCIDDARYYTYDFYLENIRKLIGITTEYYYADFKEEHKELIEMYNEQKIKKTLSRIIATIIKKVINEEIKLNA